MTCPSCGTPRGDAAHDTNDNGDEFCQDCCPTCVAEREVERLTAWKAEAMVVLSRWDDVWVALGRPGALGEDKSVAALRTVLANGPRP